MCLKKLLLVILALAVSVIAASAQENPTPKPTPEAPRISLADAKQAFDKGSAFIIDARSTEAYKAEHIKGAVSSMEVDQKKLPKDKTIIVYCS